MKKSPFVLLLILLFISCRSKSDSEETEINFTLFAAVDDLIVRENPDPSLEPIYKLSELEEMEFLGEYSSNQYTFTLRGKEFTTNFLKVRFTNDWEGWVFAGGVSPVQAALQEYEETELPMNDPPEVKHQNANFIWMNGEPEIRFFGVENGFQDGEYWTIVQQDGSNCHVFRSEIMPSSETGEFDRYEPVTLEYIKIAVLNGKSAQFILYGMDIPKGDFQAQVGSSYSNDDWSQEWSYNGKDYKYEVVNRSTEAWFMDVDIYWTVDDQSQRIFHIDGWDQYYGYLFEILWVGDLDQDGDLDLISVFSLEYEGGQYLFLSSLADEGELLGLAFIQDLEWDWWKD